MTKSTKEFPSPLVSVNEELEYKFVHYHMMHNPSALFVFGSNLAGIHGAGAAQHAEQYYGAKRGIGYGLQGRSFAIPTKDEYIKTLPLERIQYFIDSFVLEANYTMLSYTYILTRIGCGLAGYTDEEILGLFWKSQFFVSNNIIFPVKWQVMNSRIGTWI